MNIILLIVDTLRYDYLGANGNTWIETPNLDRLAAQSWCFDRAFCNSFPTIPFRTDLIRGTFGDPFYPWHPLRFDVPTLPGILAENGYATQLIHDTPHLVNGGHAFDYPFHYWTFVRGAEVDRARLTDPEPAMLANWRRDPLWDFCGDAPLHASLKAYARTNRQRRADEDWNAARTFLTAAEFLHDNRRRGNFFLWLDCFDPHEPWDVPPEYAKRYVDDPSCDGSIDPRAFQWKRVAEEIPPEAAGRLAALYAGKVSWMDRWFGRLLEALEESGLRDDTALIVVGDHGTNVGERGRWGKGQPVFEQEAHVPLLLSVPGLGHGRSDALVQPQDLFATVLALGDCHAAAEAPGNDLVALARTGGSGRYGAALSGAWGSPVVTAFGGDHYAQLSGARRTVYAYGRLDPIADPGEHIAADLLARAGAELEARGASAETRARFAAGEPLTGAEPRPELASWRQYFTRLYDAS